HITINVNAQEEESYNIKRFKEDLTGDGLHEQVNLKGELLTSNGDYYRKIWISITSLLSDEWRIPLKGGYNPSIQFVDLNHDQINDLFYSSKQSEKDSSYQFNAYSIANGNMSKIN